MIAFCKLVVVLTLLPLASECEGKTCEAAPFAGFVECVWMQKSECETRVKPLSQKGFTSIVRITRMQVAAYDRAAASPHSDGHRLANGLLAPRLC